MGNNAVRTIILLMVLVVFAFVIGAQVSDSIKGSIGAFVLIGVVIGGAFMVYMGPRVWQLLFILPPFVEVVPLPHMGHAIMPCGFAPLVVACLVLVCWVVLWAIGRARIRWRWAAVLDIPFLVFVGIMVAAYVKHPVVINELSVDSDDIGGQEMLYLICAVFAYLVFSIIPVTKQELEKCLPLCFKLFLVASALFIIRGLAMRGAAADEDLDLNVRRIYVFYPVGSALFFLVYSKYPVMKLLRSIRCMLALSFGAVATLITGQRQNMALLAMGIVFIASAKREISILIVTLLGGYIGLLYLSESRLIESIPENVQRSVASVPGVKVDRRVNMGATGTMKTRYALWSSAMDPRTGIIKDYVWGDGFAFSRAYMRRGQIAKMRGVSKGTADSVAMGISRNFHNGAIQTIAHIGYVGLAWCALMCIIAWGVSMQVLRVWSRTETYPYIILGIINLPIVFLVYPYANCGTKHFIFALPSYFFLKMCYCIARENGLLRPLFFTSRYVPMMIQESEKIAPAV